MQYVVEMPSGWWLKGTVPTGQLDRATLYPSMVAADAAIYKALPFYTKAIIKTWKVVEG